MSGAWLRDARPTDAGAVGGILSAFIDETPWMPRIHTRAQDLGFAGDLIARGWVRLAGLRADVVGFLARDAAQVHALYVRADARGQGIGSLLLRDAQSQSPRLTLATFADNLPAQRFYLRHGFRETERTDGSQNDEGLPDVSYCWIRAAASGGAP